MFYRCDRPVSAQLADALLDLDDQEWWWVEGLELEGSGPARCTGCGEEVQLVPRHVGGMRCAHVSGCCVQTVLELLEEWRRVR